MKIPLDEFELVIDEGILKRGLSYFKKGAVTDFSENSNGEYDALVSGSEEYTVQLKIKNNIIIEHNCDCPYNMGPVCKHIAAVVFYLHHENLGLNPSEISNSKKPKSKSEIQQVKDLLNNISHRELVDFVNDRSKKDKVFRNYLLASFGHKNQDISRESYKKLINSILNNAASSDGWIGWTVMKFVVKALEPLLENAEKYLKNKQFENVFFISSALLEEMTDAFQYADDSKGDLGYFVETALDYFSKLTTENISGNLKREIFEYCITAFKLKVFEGWDWHLGMLEIACKVVDNKVDAAVIINCLDTIEQKYEKELGQSLQLDLLKRYEKPQIVDDFINKNISNPIIRNQEIEKAFESKNFEKAKHLSIDGIKYDERDKPGLAKDWYDWLLKISMAQNDTPKIIEFARYRLLNDFGATLDYYKILKDNIEAEKWQDFLEEIIIEITPKTNWTYTELIRNIYIKEEWWDRLFMLLKQNTSLENIESNQQYLSKNYSSELIKLYFERITNYVDKNVGRNYYQKACKYIRNMKKLGGNHEAKDLIELFRKEYPQRKALMEELNKI
jgi:hypothetical protein